MERIETRSQLIRFIEKDAVHRAIGRACHHENGSVQVLGGFSMIPPTERPGWIVSITSAYGQTWLVAVLAYDYEHVFKSRVVEAIPWSLYVGQTGREYNIYDGDNPVAACRAKENCDDGVP